jgi:hypothetical protein
MMLQVDEATGKLDKGFVKDIALAGRTEPDMLEDIVGFVIFLRIEESEVFEVARMESSGRVHVRHAGGNALVLTHGDQAASSAA